MARDGSCGGHGRRVTDVVYFGGGCLATLSRDAANSSCVALVLLAACFTLLSLADRGGMISVGGLAVDPEVPMILGCSCLRSLSSSRLHW